MATSDDPQSSCVAADPPPAQSYTTTPTQQQTNGNIENHPRQPSRDNPQTDNITNGHKPTTQITRQSEQPTLYDVPDYELAKRADRNAYRQLVKNLHKEMSGGDSTEYVETKIAMPRSLQGLKTGQVMSKLFNLNPSLNSEKWASVMADVVGQNLVVGTVCKIGHEMIDALQEIKVEPGRTVKVPPASKPNNFYYVELLLPYERELHVELMEAFLMTFPTARHISMPGKKPWGTTRRLRLYLNTTLAPKEVFTQTNDKIPIREVVLDCGTAAQVIQKWQRLNQFRPPHLTNRWYPTMPTRSYAAAAATTNTTTTPTSTIPPENQPLPPPRSYAAAAATNNGINTTPIANSSTRRPDTVPITKSSTPRTSPTAQTPVTHMDTTADVPHHPSLIPNNRNRNQTESVQYITEHDDEDWTAPSQLIPPRNTLTETNNHAVPTNTNTSNDMVIDRDNLTGHNPLNPAPTPITATINDKQVQNAPETHATNTTQEDGAQTTTPTKSPTTLGVSGQCPPTASTQLTPTTRTTKQHLAHPAPARSGSDSLQWHQVKKPRTRKTTTAQNQAPQTIQKSGSRTKKPKQNNKFAALEFEVQPAFEDDPIAPINVSIPSHLRRTPRQKQRTTRKVWTKHVSDAISHTQEVRHPAHTLQHLSPDQSQVLLRTTDPKMKPHRDRLLRQIALLRAARTNVTPKNILLDQVSDDNFMTQVQARIAECPDSPKCSADTQIDIPLSTILNRDELQVRSSIYFAWIDLASRALLPALYDAWPDQPTWNGTALVWLPATDPETACLQDESLAMLAACPTLQDVWAHSAKDSPDLDRAIQTAANQWRLFKSKQATHRTMSAVHPPHNE